MVPPEMVIQVHLCPAPKPSQGIPFLRPDRPDRVGRGGSESRLHDPEGPTS